MYVEVDEALGPFYVSVLSPSRATRLFQIEVCQIESVTSAPTGCLQYHTEPEGVLESFNYQLQSSIAAYREPGYFVSARKSRMKFSLICFNVIQKNKCICDVSE